MSSLKTCEGFVALSSLCVLDADQSWTTTVLKGCEEQGMGINNVQYRSELKRGERQRGILVVEELSFLHFILS